MSNLEKMITAEIKSRGVPRLVASSDERATVYYDNGASVEPLRAALETSTTAGLATAGYARLVASTDAMKTLYLDNGTSVLPLNGYLYKWITYGANNSTTTIGVLPANAVVVESVLVVTTPFNAGGDNLLKVGVTGDDDAVVASTDISGAAARKLLTSGDVVYSTSSRTLVAKYNQTSGEGSAASAGAGLVLIRYVLVPAAA